MIDQQVNELLNLFLKILLYSLIVATIPNVITLQSYFWERFKKYKYAEVKEKEMIIVGKAKQISEQDQQLERQEMQAKKLNQEIEVLQHKRKQLEELTKLEEESDPKTDEEEIDETNKKLENMTILEMREIAKEKGLSMYSKLSKKQLLERLQTYY